MFVLHPSGSYSRDDAVSVRYTKGMQQIRGVNLGGWLVLERWITPELFEGCEAQDEYGLCTWSPEEAKRRLVKHRETFITRETIRQVRDMGLNTVRLPIGYWLFDEVSPFIKGADDYVDSLFSWCEELGIGVILDIHAAQGSQNGWDHSGRSGRIGWGSAETVLETLKFLEAVLDRYGRKKALRALEVLNEPHWDVPIHTLVAYYEQAYQRIRQYRPDLTVVMSDAFRPEEMSKQLAKRHFEDVLLDVHLYQLFTDEDRALDLDGHVRKAQREWSTLLQKLTKRIPVLVGEWSAAMHELYLPIDQPRHTAGYTTDDYVMYFRTQRQVFESTGAGWTYWTAKTSQGGPWSLLDNPQFLYE